ncbi:hypothetical protein SMGD1_2189 [Sulfurimonas gotlandica GD1]|jgi:precorrin-3B methylase|uniref:Uncharacterized protein n=1 Tax=Sulfurimonas gotlandica (strain DSM 19862 / JCM 16533 / GD1) TaxID=929558 RepID=B6BN12_SULGG|nr:hypothetical protein [Sulfurimonas gotlandica]EDZ61566.1 conserved hypothetical protein [Sulfurimonas gotlandica GD1]EHP30712.1 hypothetical protein SMGD1_2189 [Sulfurimonas gotlandica GD1]
MGEFIKFENLEEELVDLTDVLKNSLQSEVLSIKKLVKSCDKFKKISKTICNLDEAEYVIFSKYMTKQFHQSESYIFVDATGKNVCNVSGRDIDLYDMIMDCENLVEKKDQY